MTETKQQSRSKKFVKDFGIYAIGNLGSKLITFLMVPLYTYFVEKPSDYGYFDLCLQVCMLLVPIVTLQLRDGSFRFLLETQESSDRTKIVSFVYRTLFFTSSVTVAVALLTSMVIHINYLWYTIALLITMCFYEVLAQVSRGLGNNKAFIAIGLIASFGIGIFSLIFVVGFKMGIAGIFLANILARIVALLLVELKMQTLSRFFRIKVDFKQVSREILHYSLPLIPVTLCWWLTTTSDRFFVKYFLGLEITGLYAVAVRFGGVIHTLSNIFFQTWQENAIQQFHSKDRDIFFSNVFNNYIFILAFTLIAFTFTVKICFNWIVGPNYQQSIEYIYLVNLSTILFAITAFFEIPYQCAKDTKAAMPSIVLTAIINIVLNLILTPILHIYGVIVTSITSYLVLILYRWIDTRKYFTLHFHKRTLIPLILILVGILPFYWSHNHYVDILFIIIASVILYYSTSPELREDILGKIKKKVVPTHRTT